MENKIFTVCIFEKLINNFHKKFSEYTDCNIRRGVKRYQNVTKNIL